MIKINDRTEILVEIQNLSLNIQNKKILKNVSFSILKNETVAIVGESGSGKTLTALSLIGLIPNNSSISSNKMKFLNTSLSDNNYLMWRSIRGKTIGIIFQEPHSSLNPSMKCGKQLLEVLKIHYSNNKNENKKIIFSAFKDVQLNGFERIYNSYPHQLSGGQKQRVMIAMAILCKPKLLIADEPTTALDVTVQKEIILLLKSLQIKYEMSILFISHDLNLVKHLADKVFVMKNGKIIEFGINKKLFENPQKSYTKGLLFARPSIEKRLKILPTINDYKKGNFNEKIITLEERKEKHKILYSKSPILEIIDLEKKFFKQNVLFNKKIYFHAIKSFSFKLYKGETLGLVGESGCGKSTLGRAIIYLDPPTSGKIFYNSRLINKNDFDKSNNLRKEIQFIFQDPHSSMHPFKTIGNSIMEVLKVHNILTDKKDRKKRVYDLIKKVGLSKIHFNSHPHELSGGQKQRAIIARALATNPKIIICDECVASLDISIQAKILNLLNDLKEELNLSYILISHDLSVVKYMSDRIMVMKSGKLIEFEESDLLYNNPKKNYTKKLISSII
jgi:peptide/nickel transport system ATP-binding protein